MDKPLYVLMKKKKFRGVNIVKDFLITERASENALKVLPISSLVFSFSKTASLGNR